MASASTPSADGATPLGSGVGHYENFPVASWLCPPALRPAVAAIYPFARAADDIADEGQATPEQRLAELADYRAALQRCIAQPANPVPDGAAAHWAGVFLPLQALLQSHRLPVPLLADLLSAFAQDVERTRDAGGYATQAELLDYCRRSANPVGRLLLHLYGVHDDAALRQSDQICSALQLINFWQDIGEDLPRGRCYLPADVLQRHAVTVADFEANRTERTAAMQAVVAELCAHARGLMQQGAPLVHRVPGRAGWELRLVVQGGLRILDGIAALQYRSWQHRHTLHKTDLPRLAWRALWM